MRYSTRDIATIGLFVALSATSVYIARIVPPVMIFGVSVPISFMPAISALSGILLGPKNGATAMFVYLIGGLIGLPIYAGGTGGPQYIFAPTFGFIIGFIVAAWLAGVIAARTNRLTRLTAAAVLALVPLYAIGIVYMALISDFYLRQPVSIGALTISMGPFMIKDVVENIGAGALAAALMRRLAPERDASASAGR
ncbi:MAG: biotin transporter BioY [Hydrogenibacillus sp.]|nr:biotin transporter BioY [Hydrogenibacillus sp.]